METKKTTKVFIIHCIAFLSGFSLMGYEILGSRVLAPFFGSSVYVWGALISVFMAGLSSGYAIGGKLVDRRKSFLILGIVLFASIIFISPVSLYGKLIGNYFSFLPIDIRYSALFASLSLFFIPSVCFGIISPYLVGLVNEEKPCRIGSSVGYIYAVSTAGSIFGTIFVSFYLIGMISTGTGIIFLCIPLIMCAFSAIILHSY